MDFRDFPYIFFLRTKNYANYDNPKTKNNKHDFHKNWYLPGAMEQQVLLKACQASISHNLNYLFIYIFNYDQIVTDGDASIQARLRKDNPYAAYDVDILFLHCCMLIMTRNLRKCNGKDRKYIAEFHNRLYSGILAAVKRNRATHDIVGMKKDLINAYNHCQDNHENCRLYFCDIPDKGRVPNTSPDYYLKV
jgi:hypothetical protein